MSRERERAREIPMGGYAWRMEYSKIILVVRCTLSITGVGVIIVAVVFRELALTRYSTKHATMHENIN